MATTSPTGTEFSGELPTLHEEGGTPPGIGPWRLAGRRLRRNKTALFFGFVFVVIVVMCLLAPIYSHDIAHISFSEGLPDGQIKVGHKTEFVLSDTGVPIGPTWTSHFLLGADENGRDVAVRLLYGGRNSLEVGFVATVMTMILGVLLGSIAGYLRGPIDLLIRVILDTLWSVPPLLLGVALGVSLAIGSLGPLHGNTLMVPAFVIGIVTIPYVARPVRGQVLQLREREFVDAARQQGLSNIRIVLTEILPNLSSTIIVLFPLILANAILLEAGLSFLGAGVQPPNPSWGTMISEGIAYIYASFHLVLAPGIMLVLCVLSMNIFGDGVRDAFDPRAKVRIGH